jgi:hypothetical protein
MSRIMTIQAGLMNRNLNVGERRKKMGDDIAVNLMILLIYVIGFCLFLGIGGGIQEWLQSRKEKRKRDQWKKIRRNSWNRS